MMFVLGHLGIGRAIIGSRGRTLPFLPLAVGMLLPDVIDKPLYYAHLTDFVSCTRTFGHTGLLVAVMLVAGIAAGARAWVALAVGAATHAVLDGALDLLSRERSSTWIAFTWPFLEGRFYAYPFKSPIDQIRNLVKLPVILSEIGGMLWLWWEFRRRRPRTPARTA